MKIVTSSEMRDIDRATSERFGVPSLTLMENAGAAVADFVLRRYFGAESVGVICGKGNNGGDGFVAARKLHEAGMRVSVLLLADPGELRGDAASMFKRLELQPALARNTEELRSLAAQQVYQADVLIDGILGTGFRPPVKGFYADAIEAFAKADRPVVAVDIPSGLDSDDMRSHPDTGSPIVPAHATVTFTAPKPAHLFSSAVRGPIMVAPIGSPEAAIISESGLEVPTWREMASLLSPRDPEAHKGSFGHVLVVGGSLGKAGAAAMAGMAALCSGAGLVTVACPRSVLPTVAGFMPELMTEPLEETEAGTISLRALEYGRMDALIQGKSVIALGPGIGRHTETTEFVRTLVEKFRLPTVIDADGLNAFQGAVEKLDGSAHPLVLTPHPGEMSRLIGGATADVEKDRITVARTFAQQHNLTLVLKGHRTLTALPDGRVWVNHSGNPGMATGGMGDILTGMAAGFWAQGLHRKPASPSAGSLAWEAIATAVYLHGLAGDVACEQQGELSLTATDLLSALPEAIRRVQASAREKYVWLNELPSPARS
ncbi:MAG TPA: NAD(P)H-hydrate dehydratase [Terriglobales bacterium]|nr:NAD(P)H-hydrate dehydratase [Terriglobales bacterium]